MLAERKLDENIKKVYNRRERIEEGIPIRRLVLVWFLSA